MKTIKSQIKEYHKIYKFQVRLRDYLDKLILRTIDKLEKLESELSCKKKKPKG